MKMHQTVVTGLNSTLPFSLLRLNSNDTHWHTNPITFSAGMKLMANMMYSSVMGTITLFHYPKVGTDSPFALSNRILG